ncbi:MAG TPA: rRNA maturation RNase YbeY [Stellaceae bacterium]
MTDDPDHGGTLTIDIAEPCTRWRERLPDVDRLCGEAARAALAGAGTALGPAELSIVLGDDALVQALNRQWRGHDKPTNVLSFAALPPTLPPGAPRLLGDVVLAFETLAAEAAAQGKPLAHHLRHLVVHGVLHLLGFDHAAAGEAERMEALEVAVLAGLGVPDPYRVTEASHG